MSDIVINQEVQDLAKELATQIEIAEDGVGSFKEKDFYGKFLSNNDVDVAVAEKINSLDTRFISALQLAHGEASINAMKKHPTLNQTSVTVPTLGKNTMVANFIRERQGINPQTKEAVTSYGQASVKVDIYGTGNRGMLADVKKHLRAEATKAFSK